jgi:hypothetical protein
MHNRYPIRLENWGTPVSSSSAKRRYRLMYLSPQWDRKWICASRDVLPVETYREETQPFISVGPTEHTREIRGSRIRETEDREACQQREHPFRKYFPNENALPKSVITDQFRQLEWKEKEPTQRTRYKTASISSCCRNVSNFRPDIDRTHRTWIPGAARQDIASWTGTRELLR